ncbi:nucleocapsid protein [rice transitory yellowing virus]|uniref:Nucleoprotein n=1 Tax=Rice yellow stunt virus TaxID=59380 RepID=NCAP_RYSV|nr:nucleocapsid protein [rice transitory yellowing virus]Q86523.1 RecName: Full=Nucleoprotein; Short=NP; AltName: Full=Nucleocapsid protein; Short=Protein N [rice transitory yellowing virus]BAA25154.1 nucleocapsid protein [rice transitory yellowing virus]CAA53224.1 nucleocapsid protein [rice transitory yellowing virus]
MANDNVSDYANAAPFARFANLQNRETLNPIGNEAKEIPYNRDQYLTWLAEGKLFQIGALTDAEIVAAWTTIKTAMGNNTFSETHMRSIVKIACNLRGITPGSTPLLVTYNPPQSATWAPAPSTDAIYSGTPVAGVIIPQNTGAGGEDTETEASKARAIAFICCYLLRFIVKTEEHLTNSLGNLKLQYSRLYSAQSATLSNWNPSNTWASRVKLGFDTYLTLRATVAYNIASADALLVPENVNYGLCRMLVFQHLELSGLQLYKMAMTLIAHFKLIEPNKFLSWIYDPLSEASIDQIYKIAVNYDNVNSKTHKHWKYAKLARGQYWLNTTVKRNQFLAYILADLELKYGLAGKSDYSSPKRMKALSGMPVERMTEAETISKAVEQMYTAIESAKRVDAGAAYRLAKKLGPPRANAHSRRKEPNNSRQHRDKQPNSKQQGRDKRNKHQVLGRHSKPQAQGPPNKQQDLGPHNNKPKEASRPPQQDRQQLAQPWRLTRRQRGARGHRTQTLSGMFCKGTCQCIQ